MGKKAKKLNNKATKAKMKAQKLMKKAKKLKKKAQKAKKQAKKMVKKAVKPSIMNAGKDCWAPCSKKQGKCAWCGTAGFCCRKGWKGNGCTGAMGINNRHTCVQTMAKKAKK